MPWLDATCWKACKKGLGETLHTCVTRLVAILWRALHARSKAFGFPAPNVMDILRAARFSRTISRATRRNNPFVHRAMLRYVWSGNHECNKRYSEICNQKGYVGHLCYMRPLKDVLHANARYNMYFAILNHPKYALFGQGESIPA